MTKQTVTPADVPVVILAGGRGTRLMEETQVIPKPMVSIGGKPIILHIMNHYSSYGFRKFIICLGYKGYVIKDYFLDLLKHTSSLVVHSRSGDYEYHQETVSDWDVSLIETGEHSLTGTRLHHVGGHIDAPVFCLTYGDGLSDIPIDEELRYHLEHGKTGTVAAVHPPSRFGRLDIGADGQVQSFQEKVKLHHDYINGGFFVFNKEFLGRLSSTENESLESEPLTRLAKDGQMQAYLHEGFWKCMDTMRDREDLEKIYESGKAPWII
ncbi:MAG: glucose-1-phosphate cytidylyltransferase [Verrucomicrobia bacterium]|nr:glucose-1-phosphate cytidylyltransferase [Verrucomicrobiota bacterium]